MRPALLPLALISVLLTAACAGTEGADTPDAQPAPASSSAAPVAPVEPSAPASSAPAAPEVQTVTLDVAGGEVSGDTGRVDVPLGSTFRLVVTSDVVDEVHVHGYDEYLDLEPGVPAEVEVEATIAGVYEVELHDAGTLLTRIAVS